MTLLLDLPDEILHAVLALLSAEGLTICQSTCRHLQKLAEHPLLWRAHCQASYRFWHRKHNLSNLLAGSAIETDWKKIFLLRVRQDTRISTDLDDILAAQQGRIRKIQHIFDLDDDAKDILLKHSAVPQDAEDYLARKWFSKEILGSINRKRALEVWSRLKNGEEVPIEHAFGAIDLFLLDDPPYGLDEISAHLDRIADAIRSENTEWERQSPRTRASVIGEFIRRHNLAGVREEASKHNLQNNLISIALCESDHQSLPLVSVVIFCCISQRLGIDAQPCNFPFHVHALVYPPSGLTLDNDPVTEETDEKSRVMYIDPYNGSNEVSSSSLQNHLSQMGVPREHHAQFMGKTSILELVARCGRNIVYSLLNTTFTPTVLTGDLDSVFMEPSYCPKPTFLTGTRSRYAIYWLELVLEIDISSNSPHIRRLLSRSQLSQFVDALESDFSLFDIPLVEQHLISRLRDSEEGRTLQLILRSMRDNNAVPITPKHRPAAHNTFPTQAPASDSSLAPVKHHIGLYFRHLRYRYTGIIVGWTTRCTQSEDWISTMQVDTLSGGRHQPFYNVVDNSGRDRYVAEENIVPLVYHDQSGDTEQFTPSEALMRLAGRWFRRWDQHAGHFVSNIRDEYPDD